MELRLVLSVTDRANDDLDDQLRQHRQLLELFRERRPEAVAALEEHLRIRRRWSAPPSKRPIITQEVCPPDR